MTINKFIQQHIQINTDYIENCLQLLNEGATIPFIARYRKEATKGLDEVQIEIIEKLKSEYEQIIKRQKSILASIEEIGELTTELEHKISECYDLLALEDLYLPYKRSKLTKAEKARKAGLEGLAKIIMAQKTNSLKNSTKKFVKNPIKNEKEAIEGAQFIIAEWINQHQSFRKSLRKKYRENGILKAKLKNKTEDTKGTYVDYYNFEKRLKHIYSHQYLALHRAEKKGIISLKLSINKEEIDALGKRFFVRPNSTTKKFIEEAFQDAIKRLTKPSLINETLKLKKEEADVKAIEIFSKNLRQLLLAPPLGEAKVLAIDPGFRTGCKIVCLNANGKVEHSDTIYPHPPQKQKEESLKKLQLLVKTYAIEAIAIGDGTAGRETLDFINQINFSKKIPAYLINEDGASVYSASSLARKEFPDFDVSLRGAISIGRRLMDPLAELVKIPASSIGIGQYQHEVDQKKLSQALERVLVSCVNQVGVELNTASEYLLSYVSGLGPSLAKNCVAYRNQIGGFSSIEELKNVPRLGEKAFEQCAGFLRIRQSKNILDQTGVHPESYIWVNTIAKQNKLTVEELTQKKDLIKALKKEDYPNLDHYTFSQIVEELEKPGRDPRAKIQQSQVNREIKTIEDLEIGKVLNGKVSNITQFGAFVDLGIKENGLIHKSNLAENFVKEVSDVVNLHQQVRVEIITLDIDRSRIGLKLKN